MAFISLRDNLDLSTPSGRLMMHIIGAMAQFERKLIKERVSAGMHAARKRGSRIGRPRAYANAEKIRALRAQDVPGAPSQPSWASAPVQLSAQFRWRCSMNESQLSSMPFSEASLSGLSNTSVYQAQHPAQLSEGHRPLGCQTGGRASQNIHIDHVRTYQAERGKKAGLTY